MPHSLFGCEVRYRGEYPHLRHLIKKYWEYSALGLGSQLCVINIKDATAYYKSDWVFFLDKLDLQALSSPH